MKPGMKISRQWKRNQAVIVKTLKRVIGGSGLNSRGLLLYAGRMFGPILLQRPQESQSSQPNSQRTIRTRISVPILQPPSPSARPSSQAVTGMLKNWEPLWSTSLPRFPSRRLQKTGLGTRLPDKARLKYGLETPPALATSEMLKPKSLIRSLTRSRLRPSPSVGQAWGW